LAPCRCLNVLIHWYRMLIALCSLDCSL
jgi:hypothetical protein